MEKEKREVIVSLIMSVIMAASLVALIFSIAFGWRIPKIAIGLVLIVAFVAAVAWSLIKKDKLRVTDWVGIGISFFGTVLALIYLIILIEDDSQRNVVTAISASALGGLLTLSGVALTIKYNRLLREEDEIKKARPYIFPISDTSWNSISKEHRNNVDIQINKQFSEVKEAFENEKSYFFSTIKLANSDVSMCSVSAILVNNRVIKFEHENILLKSSNSQLLINFRFKLKEKIKEISLVLNDMLGNTYFASMRFEIKQRRESQIQDIIIVSVLETSLIH